MLRAAQLWTIRDYVGQRCHNIAKTIEGQALFEEYRGAKRRSGSLNRQMWWQQEMELLEEENGDTDGGWKEFSLTSFTTRRELR